MGHIEHSGYVPQGHGPPLEVERGTAGGYLQAVDARYRLQHLLSDTVDEAVAVVQIAEVLKGQHREREWLRRLRLSPPQETQRRDGQNRDTDPDRDVPKPDCGRVPAHFGDESVAALGHGLQVALAVVVQRPAQLIDVPVDRALGDDAATPDGRHDFVQRQYLAGPGCQKLQQLHLLAWQGAFLVAGSQLAECGVDEPRPDSKACRLHPDSFIGSDSISVGAPPCPVQVIDF